VLRGAAVGAVRLIATSLSGVVRVRDRHRR
jgi:hypothetical protein